MKLAGADRVRELNVEDPGDLAQYHPTVCSVKKRCFPGKVPRTEGADHVRSFLKARQTA